MPTWYGKLLIWFEKLLIWSKKTRTSAMKYLLVILVNLNFWFPRCATSRTEENVFERKERDCILCNGRRGRFRRLFETEICYSSNRFSPWRTPTRPRNDDVILRNELTYVNSVALRSSYLLAGCEMSLKFSLLCSKINDVN